MRITLSAIGSKLDDWGIIDEHRFRPTVDLAWPRIVTGFARTSKPTADTAMVGLVLGPQAIAGLAFGYAYWRFGNVLSIGLSGGTLSMTSQAAGAEDSTRTDQVLLVSLLFGILFSIPLAVLFYTVPNLLIGVFDADPAAIGYGTVYLQILAPAIVLEFLNKVISRSFAGVADTFTPMVIRSSAAVLNIALNAIFVFVFGLGVAGVALGTVLSTATVTIVFVWGLARRRLPFKGHIPVGFRLVSPMAQRGMVKELLTISAPLIVRRGLISFVAFPLLAITAVFGSIAVAAFEIARRVRHLANSANWGFSTVSSTYVGQNIGADDTLEAEGYATDVVRLSLLVHLAMAALLIIFAEPVARVFVTEPETLSLAAVFVQIAAISLLGKSLDATLTGALRGAGDTNWPFYGTLFGLYICTVPLAYLGTITWLGIAALYLALIVETLIPGLINWYRFRTGAWKSIGKSYQT